MRTLTKIIAMTLAVLMLAAMTVVTCGAVSNAKGTVTVEKAVVGETVKFYRVLDYVDATGAYGVSRITPPPLRLSAVISAHSLTTTALQLPRKGLLTTPPTP